MHNYRCGASFTSLLYHANEVRRTAPQEPLLPALRRAPRRSAAAAGAPSRGSERLVLAAGTPRPLSPLRWERCGGGTQPAPRGG